MAENFAVVEDGEVINIIVAENGYSQPGVTLVEYSNETFCQAGMFYEDSDGSFQRKNPSTDAED